MGTNEKEIAYSVITKIFNEKGIILNEVSDGTLKEMIQAVDIISRRTDPIKDQDELIISKYEKGLSRMLSDYPKLKPSVADIAAGFEQICTGATEERSNFIKNVTQKALNESIAKDFAKIKEIVDSVCQLTMNTDNFGSLSILIGKQNAKELQDHSKSIYSQFQKCNINSVEKEFKKLAEWCEKKQEVIDAPVFKKIKRVISSAVSVISAVISNKPNASEKVNEFKQNISSLVDDNEWFSKYLADTKSIIRNNINKVPSNDSHQETKIKAITGKADNVTSPQHLKPNIKGGFTRS
ncbi:hypothetical protein [Candidatus Tisiphia endosymbiont of Ditula angustiorana]|uniref:hypothetical protein n=1 Tax=Candidatus Tisiphia endosymbiont of Ditula angustiorana TaxID=3066272 RepID=UPI00312C738C